MVVGVQDLYSARAQLALLSFTSVTSLRPAGEIYSRSKISPAGIHDKKV